MGIRAPVLKLNLRSFVTSMNKAGLLAYSCPGKPSRQISGSGIEVFRTIGSLQQRRLLRILTEFPIMPLQLHWAPNSNSKVELLAIYEKPLLKMTI